MQVIIDEVVDEDKLFCKIKTAEDNSIVASIIVVKPPLGIIDGCFPMTGSVYEMEESCCYYLVHAVKIHTPLKFDRVPQLEQAKAEPV